MKKPKYIKPGWYIMEGSGYKAIAKITAKRFRIIKWLKAYDRNWLESKDHASICINEVAWTWTDTLKPCPETLRLLYDKRKKP